MITIKRCNYITGDLSDIGSGVSQIVKFLELSGRNYLLISNGKPKTSIKTTSLYSYLQNQYTYNDLDEFKDILNDKSKLFRVDLLVFDFWNLSRVSIMEYKKVIDNLNIDHIIVAKEYHYKSSDDVTDYHIRRELKFDWVNSSTNDFKSYIIVTDNINKWTSNLDDLMKSYIRDKKIDNLFGDNDITT
jgi:hypothetical protein